MSICLTSTVDPDALLVRLEMVDVMRDRIRERLAEGLQLLRAALSHHA